MITFINENKEINTILPSPKINKSCEKTLFGEYLPVINSPFTIRGDELFNCLSCGSELKDINFSSLVDLFKTIDVKNLIGKSKIMNNNISLDIETIKKDYDKFNLESKMKFPYTINLYMSNYNIRIIKHITHSINNLNYGAFVSDSKSEIDDIVNDTKMLLRYDLFLPNSKDNLDEIIHTVITPFATAANYIADTYPSPNTPFHKKDDYITCLLAPYKYKLNNLSGINNIFNTEKNKLYALMLNGYNALQKEVLTYRAKDIITLFLIIMYITYVIIEYNLVYSKELHEVAFFIYNEIQYDAINESQVLIPYSVHELFRLFNLDDNGSYYSTEAQNTMSMQDNIKLNEIDESYKRRWAQLQKIYIKVFKVGISKILSKANSLFFKKYYGRIPHLYSEYGNKATVVENRMTGDPGEILNTVAVKYVEKMSEDATGIFNGLLQMARRLTSTSNIKEKINVLKSYCTNIKVDENNIDSIKKAILNETRFRIASSILQDNTIYGFTVDGIMQNRKFPPANHIITSLFVKNPHEQPLKQRVSDIFNNSNSLLMFAYPEKIAKFNNLYRQSASKIIDTFNPKIVSVTEKNMNKSAKRYAYELKTNNTPQLNSSEETNPNEQKKISNMIDRAMVHAIDMAIEQKRRCLQCTGIAHDMIGRVIDLAKRCVVAMLAAERQETDPAYKTGLSQNKNSRINKQNEANRNHINPNSAIENKTKRRRTNNSTSNSSDYY
jgi:hypothetical protein